MNHNEILNYIINTFKNIVDENIKSIENTIRRNINNTYKLKTPSLHKHCIISSIEKINKILEMENSLYSEKVGTNIYKYLLTLNDDFFDMRVSISDAMNIIPIGVIKNIVIKMKKTNK